MRVVLTAYDSFAPVGLFPPFAAAIIDVVASLIISLPLHAS